MITNSFCNVLDNKLCPIQPIYYSMNNDFIAISDYDYIYILQYRGFIKTKIEGNNADKNSKNSDLGLSIRTKYNVSMNKLDPKSMNEFCFFIEDDLNPGINYDYYNFRPTKKAKNQICNLYLSSNFLYVAKTNGIIHKYNLYLMNLEKKFIIEENIKEFGLSPFEQYLWCLNTNDYLSIYNLEKDKPEKLNYYQKEVWDIKWSIKKDDEEINKDTLEFAILQKNRLYFINNLQIEGENSLFLDENKNKLPDVILVRKKPIIDIKGKKLERLKFSNDNKKNKKKQNENENEDEDKEDMKGFIEEIYEDEKELKNNYINENNLQSEEKKEKEKEDEPKKENEKKE